MWSGVLLTLAGVTVMILASDGRLSLGSRTLTGDLTTLSGTVGFCLCTIFASDLTRRMSPLSYTTWTMVSGALLLLPLAAGELLTADWSAATALNWFELLFSASFALVLGYILWNTGVKESGPASTAVFGNLSPVWTAVFATVILGESWGAMRITGAAAVLAGVLLVRLGQAVSPAPKTSRETS